MHKQMITIPKVFLKLWGIQFSHQAPLASQEFYTGKTSSQNAWLWRLVGLGYGRQEGPLETKTLLLKGMHKILHTLKTQLRNSDLKGAWLKPTFWPQGVSWRGRRQEATGTPHHPPQGYRRWLEEAIWGACSNTRTLVLASAILKSSL